jgi:xanthine dehydrogenase accessory factor
MTRMKETAAASDLITEAITRSLADGAIATLVTLVDVPENHEALMIGAKLLITESGERVGSLGDSALNDASAKHVPTFLASRDETKLLKIEEFAPDQERLRGAAVLFERIEPEPRLVICGAGHVGASLARFAALAGYIVSLIDDRAEFLKRELFSEPGAMRIELIVANDWATSVSEAIGNGRGVSVAIVTRGHKQDEDCLRAAIAAKPDYVGMIGSKRRTNIVLDKLREKGVNETVLRNVRAPIGLDIGAVSPEEVALAILAEIVAERRGGSGAALSQWRRA